MRRLRSWLTDRTTMPGRPVVAGLVGLLILAAGSARAQGPNRTGGKFYPDSSDDAEKLLRNAANHARDRQWSEAINIYQRVIDQFGDKVVMLPKDRAGGGCVQRFCLVRGRPPILPCRDRPVATRGTRDLSQPDRRLAERLVSQGASQRDLALAPPGRRPGILQLVGRRRARVLGDLAFQDGRFGEALAMYRRLVADRAGDSGLLVHPDPSVDLARVAAKKLLCRAAAGEDRRPRPSSRSSRGAIPRRRVRWPAARGLMRRSSPNRWRRIIWLRPSQPDSRWPTFAGSLTRSKVVPGPIDVGSTQWRVELEKVSGKSSAGIRTPRGWIGAATTVHPSGSWPSIRSCWGTR